MAQLNTLLPAGSDALQDVKQGKTFTFAGFPAARYFLAGIKEHLEDQRNQYRTYLFRVEIFQKLSGDDKSALEGLVEDATEAVMNAIDADFTWGGKAMNVVMETGAVQEVELPFGVGLVMHLNVSVHVLLFF